MNEFACAAWAARARPTAPEAGAMPAPGVVPDWLYWVLLVVGVVAAAVGFSAGQRKT